MWSLATAMTEIALRRRGPESLPDSTFLVLFLLVVDIFVTLVSLLLSQSVSRVTLILLASDAVLSFAFVFAVLTFFRLERRFRQTVSAMLGADIIISLAFLPIGAVGLAMGLEPLASPLLGARLIFYFWYVFIAASILARALSQPFFVGLMFEILYVLTSLSIGDFLAPAADVLPTEAI